MGWLTGKIALYVCIGLAALCIALTGRLMWVGAKRDKAVAELSVANQNLLTVRAANAQWLVTTEALRKANEECVGTKQASQAQADKVVAEAKAKAADASRTLKAWLERYAKAVRSPDCKSVAESVLCPAMRDY